MADKVKVKVQTVKVPVEAPKISPRLVAGCLAYLVVLINAVFAFFGVNWKLNISEEHLYQIVSFVMLVGAFIRAYWKNHDITAVARIKAVVANQVKIGLENVQKELEDQENKQEPEQK